MGTRRLHHIKRFPTLGACKSGRLKVAALKPFHPTATPSSKKIGFLYYDTEGVKKLDMCPFYPPGRVSLRKFGMRTFTVGTSVPGAKLSWLLVYALGVDD